MYAGIDLPFDQRAKGFLIDALVFLERCNQRGTATL
jgi:hypothetical protein